MQASGHLVAVSSMSLTKHQESSVLLIYLAHGTSSLKLGLDISEAQSLSSTYGALSWSLLFLHT